MGHRIKLAHIAVDGQDVAEREADATCSTNLEWVELDGHRFENVVNAKVEMGDHVNLVTVTFYGAIELVPISRETPELETSWRKEHPPTTRLPDP